MDLYLFTLLLGLGGLLLMAVLGLSHGHGAGHGHRGLVPRHGVKGGHPRVGGKPSSHGHHYLFDLLAPQVLFGLLFGFGVVGLLLHPLVRVPLALLVTALVGAWFFQHVLMTPLWNFLLGFASKPAQTLDTLVLEQGHAATDFDANGRGLVAVDLDGQTRQILGTLSREERTHGTRVRTGDRLFIRAVDGARNTCQVSRGSC